MAKDNPANIGQADARATELVAGVESLKDTKEFVGLAHVKPNTIVPNKDDGFILAVLPRGDLDFRRIARAGIFDRVCATPSLFWHILDAAVLFLISLLP